MHDDVIALLVCAVVLFQQLGEHTLRKIAVYMWVWPRIPHFLKFSLRQTLSQSVKLILRGAHGHVTGSRPWVYAENNIEGLMANIVGKKKQNQRCLDSSFCPV